LWSRDSLLLKKAIGKILSIDYGSRRIGIALSDESRTIAFGREAIPNNSETLRKIIEFVESNDVSGIVLGYPLNLKGLRTPQTEEVERFERKLSESLEQSNFSRIEIVRWDERLTSKAAQHSMLQSGMKKSRRKDKSNLDIISATLLLQSYLDYLCHSDPENLAEESPQ
jgi:putative Holliday junction resolvase